MARKRQTQTNEELAAVLRDVLGTHQESDEVSQPVLDEDNAKSVSDIEQDPESVGGTTAGVPLTPIAPNEGLPTIPQLVIAVAILGAVLGFPAATELWSKQAHATPQAPQAAQVVHVEEAAVPPVSTTTSQQEEDLDPFANVVIDAKAAYVWDVVNRKPLYEKSAQTQLPLASLTKLMTALVAYEEGSADDAVPITLSAILQDGENGFEDGETWNLFALMDYMLMTSSNDGAYALAAAVGQALGGTTTDSADTFVDRMNAKAAEIGLLQTYFTNATGLDTSESQSGSYGSARDVAVLMTYILEYAPRILSHTTETVAEFSDLAGKTFVATNTNESIAHVENPLGSKTGYTVLAGGNLAVAFEPVADTPVVIVVLGSSREGRFRDVDTLRAEVLKHYNQ